MSEDEILEEQQKLIQSLDPNVLKFLTSKRVQLPANEIKIEIGSMENKILLNKTEEVESMDCENTKTNVEQPIDKSEDDANSTSTGNKSGLYFRIRFFIQTKKKSNFSKNI